VNLISMLAHPLSS